MKTSDEVLAAQVNQLKGYVDACVDHRNEDPLDPLKKIQKMVDAIALGFRDVIIALGFLLAYLVLLENPLTIATGLVAGACLAITMVLVMGFIRCGPL